MSEADGKAGGLYLLGIALAVDVLPAVDGGLLCGDGRFFSCEHIGRGEMCRLSCSEGDISVECRNICSLLGCRFSVMIGLRALCADGKAESAGGEDAGFLDLFVVIEPRIVLGGA